MKIIKLILYGCFLGWGIITSAVFSADEPSEFRQKLDRRVKQLTINFTVEELVENLFVQHSLSNTQEEHRFSRQAAIIGSDMMDKYHHLQALPYLVYAEQHWEPTCINYLWQIGTASSDSHINVPENLREKIRKRFLENYNIPEKVNTKEKTNPNTLGLWGLKEIYEIFFLQMETT